MLNNMETMKFSTPPNAEEDAEAIDPDVLSALRDLACELATPSAESDLVIRRAAAARLAAIRRHSRVKWIATAATAMAACVLVGIFLGKEPEAVKPPTVDLARDDAAIILAEVSALFPGQIRAIHRDESGLHLTLSDTPSATPTQALVIEIADGKSGREIITFSGQSVEIMGQLVTVHADADGAVFLNGQAVERWNDLHAAHLSIRTITI